MILFGLTGGIASGKSHVAGLLAGQGAVLLDADRHAHTVLADPEVRDALVARWGAEILDQQGDLQRSALAERVFGESGDATTERRFLEGLVHPRVRELLRADLAAAHISGAPAVVLDIPLLHEAGWADECDAILFVDASDMIRHERAAKRGWSAEELAQREQAQMPMDKKRELADMVISGETEAAAKQGVDEAWRRWVVNG
jgi:dephospho-CoA kinase